MRLKEKPIPEKERLNRLIARFLRLNDEGKVYMNDITRHLARICGPPVKPGFGTPGESGTASGFTGIEGNRPPKRTKDGQPLETV